MMTDGPQSAVDPVMAEALEWVLKVNENPDDPQIRRGLTDWLTGSEANAKAYRKAERIWKLTGDVPPAYPERWSARGPNAQLNHGKSGQSPPRRDRTALRRPESQRARPSRKWWLGLGGSACAASLAALLMLGSSVLDRADYRTGAGEIRQVTLPDGSLVTLGGGSAIRVSYDTTQRRVTLLCGEAFFNVMHNAQRPFTVEASGIAAHDVGTAFDVDLEPANIDIAVQSGAVGVTVGDSAATMLIAGERLSIDRATRAGIRTTEPVEAIATWRSGRLVVDNVAVGDVVQQLRRYYRGYIWLRDSELNNRRISGVYDLNDPVSALKAIVEPHAGIVTEITPLVLVVSAR